MNTGYLKKYGVHKADFNSSRGKPTYMSP